MRRLVDHVLCKLPFEADWYKSRQCHPTYVGHPYFDEVRRQSLDQAFVDEQSQRPGMLVTILPGSRTQEVAKNLSSFLKAAGEIRRRVPDVRFAVASFNEKQAALARQLVAALEVPVEVFAGRTPELIRLGRCCLACSGSVSLELLYHAKPTIILYRVGWFPYTVARNLFIKVKFITLVNLLAADDPFLRAGARYDPRAAAAEDVLFPEHLTYEDRTQQMAAQIAAWLSDESRYERRVRELQELKQQHASGGASSRAAGYILRHLGSGTPALSGPHFDRSVLPSAGKRREESEK